VVNEPKITTKPTVKKFKRGKERINLSTLKI